MSAYRVQWVERDGQCSLVLEIEAGDAEEARREAQRLAPAGLEIGHIEAVVDVAVAESPAARNSSPVAREIAVHAPLLMHGLGRNAPRQTRSLETAYLENWRGRWPWRRVTVLGLSGVLALIGIRNAMSVVTPGVSPFVWMSFLIGVVYAVGDRRACVDAEPVTTSVLRAGFVLAMLGGAALLGAMEYFG